MRQSHNDFTVIQTLPPGLYHYRFVVDGKWQTDPSQPMITDANGEVNNVIEVKEQKKEDTIFHKKCIKIVFFRVFNYFPVVNQSPPGSYGQLAYEDAMTQQSPPSLPPHLMRALLNTAPPKAGKRIKLFFSECFVRSDAVTVTTSCHVESFVFVAS
jgi:5'-AMP-activated protein kinase regulatory beta subunit